MIRFDSREGDTALFAINLRLEIVGIEDNRVYVRGGEVDRKGEYIGGERYKTLHEGDTITLTKQLFLGDGE